MQLVRVLRRSGGGLSKDTLRYAIQYIRSTRTRTFAWAGDAGTAPGPAEGGLASCRFLLVAERLVVEPPSLPSASRRRLAPSVPVSNRLQRLAPRGAGPKEHDRVCVLIPMSSSRARGALMGPCTGMLFRVSVRAQAPEHSSVFPSTRQARGGGEGSLVTPALPGARWVDALVIRRRSA